MMQHIVKEALAKSGGDTGGVCINMIGQVNIEKGGSEEKGGAHEIHPHLRDTNDPVEEEEILKYIQLIRELPPPRFDNMFKLLFATAKYEAGNGTDSADFLGITRERFYAYAKKFKLVKQINAG